jgi:hypothetical protein
MVDFFGGKNIEGYDLDYEPGPQGINFKGMG